MVTSTTRVPRALVMIMMIMATTGLAVLGSAGPAQARPRHGTVTVATDVDHLTLTDAPCSAGQLAVRLTNTGSTALYANASVTAAGLTLTERQISTYLPPGYTYVDVIRVTAAPGTQAGEHPITIASGSSTATAIATVGTVDDDPNLALRAEPTASSVYPGRPACGALDGITDASNWAAGVGWSDNTDDVYPDWWQADFAQSVTVSRVVVWTTDSAALPARTEGLRDWDVQVPDGAGWRTVASVRGNSAASVTSTFAAVTTSSVRILCIAGNHHYSRIAEFEAYAG